MDESMAGASDVEDVRDRLVLKTLPHVAFEGWTGRALRTGLTDADLADTDGALLFPGGVTDVIDHWMRLSDRRMMEEMQRLDPESMRGRERVAAAVRARIETNVAYREAVRRTISFLALPPNVPTGLRLTYRTVDAIWYACGDTATDFSFYTKRLSLAGVYTSTILHWLDDDSEDFEATWAFLERRIDDAMRLLRFRPFANFSPSRLIPSILRRPK